MSTLRQPRPAHPCRPTPSGLPACPRCRGVRVKRNGRSKGVQTYYCHHCRRSFNERTGTPWARFHRPQARQAFQLLMDQGLSLREAARRLGIGLATAWRWRHQELVAMQRDQAASTLQGEVVVDSIAVDGQRRYWGRYPQGYWRRGWRLDPVRGHGRIPLTVVLAVQIAPRSVRPAVVGEVVPGGGLRLALARALTGHLGPGTTLRARCGAARVEAREQETRLEWEPFDGPPTVPPTMPGHLLPAHCLRQTFVAWMDQFRGVAMHYLARYLAWFAWLVGRGSLRVPLAASEVVPAVISASLPA